MIPGEVTIEMIWPILATLVIFTLTVVLPGLGKMYVDKGDAHVLAKIRLMDFKINLMLDHMKIKVPKEDI